jgi:hypothetical protein
MVGFLVVLPNVFPVSSRHRASLPVCTCLDCLPELVTALVVLSALSQLANGDERYLYMLIGNTQAVQASAGDYVGRMFSQAIMP